MIDFFRDDEVKFRVDSLVREKSLNHIDSSRVFCIKSKGTKGSLRCVTRFYYLSRAIQKALNVLPSFIIEVFSERYDLLDESGKNAALLNVLSYFPKRSKSALRHYKGTINFDFDVEVKSRVERVVNSLGWSHIDLSRVFCVKSVGTKSKGVIGRTRHKIVCARCWCLPRACQQALGISPAYVIEMIGEYFDKLSDDEKDKFIIHELLHIPFTFSGSPRHHRGASNRELVTPSVVNKYFNELRSHEGISWV